MLRAARERRFDRRLDREIETRAGLKWTRSTPCDTPLYDAGAAQVGSRLFVFGGYIHLGKVSGLVRIFDLDAEQWLEPIVAPPGLPTSHFAIVSDQSRFIYCAGGQVGAQCSPAVADVFVLDTSTAQWSTLSALPAPRYAGTMQLWRGHLHYIGGAKEDRWTPAADHWCIPVEDGLAQAETWSELVPIPVPGMHRGSGLSGDALFVFGGQQGDFIAVAGAPDFKCTGHTQETYLSASFRLDTPDGSWKRLSDMPIPASHTDFSVVERNGKFFVIGGQIYKHPETFYLRLTDAVQSYDKHSDFWTLAGHLPRRLKLPVLGTRGDNLFVLCGQCGQFGGDTPGKIAADVWKTDLADMPEDKPHSKDSVFRNNSVLLVAPSVNYSGASLLLLETAARIVRSGGAVRLVSLSDDTSGWTAAARFRIPVLPPETTAKYAAEADLVIANTASKIVMDWVAKATTSNSVIAEKLMCWVHEIDIEHFLPAAKALRMAAMTVFDSEACRSAWQEVFNDIRAPTVINPGLSPAIAKQAEIERLPLPDRPQSRQIAGLLDRAEIRAHLGVKESDFLILSLATVEERKGQKLLVRTVADLAENEGLPLKVLLVGFRNWRQRLKFLARLRSRDRRVLTRKRAYVWQTEIAAFYHAADAFVTNTQGISTFRGECFGRATIEAMSMGLPTLGTAAGGTIDIIEDGISGLLFPTGPEGQHVLANHLRRLATDPEFTGRLAKSGRQRVLAKFSEDRFLQQLECAIKFNMPRPKSQS